MSDKPHDNVQDEGQLGKYFHLMYNMADDDLDPYEYRLLGHYRRVCGQGGVCFETTKTTAKKCHIGHNTIPKVRQRLQAKGYIVVTGNASGVNEVTLVDMMAENVKRYAPPPTGSGTGGQPDPVGEGQPDPVDKEELILKNLSPVDKPPTRKSRKPREPQPRDLIADAIARGAYGMPKGTKITALAANLVIQQKFGVGASPGLAEYQSLASELDAMYERWPSDHPGLSKPRKGESICAGLADYRATIVVSANNEAALGHWVEREIESGIWKRVWEPNDE